MSAPASSLCIVEFEPEDHTYRLNGHEVDSVTRVLEAEGLSGSSFFTERDRRRGTAVHRIALLIDKRPWRGSTVEEIVRNSPWDPRSTNPVLHGYGFAVARFHLEHNFRPTLVEQPVGSVRLQLCGMLDAWGQIDGKNTLVDYKSGQPQAAADLQTALYDALLEETFGLKTEQRILVWLKPDGTYKAYPPRPSGGMDMVIAQSAVNLYRWRKQHNKL